MDYRGLFKCQNDMIIKQLQLILKHSELMDARLEKLDNQVLKLSMSQDLIKIRLEHMSGSVNAIYVAGVKFNRKTESDDDADVDTE
jgi:hypothetical protein